MLGHIAQIITITSYANDFLKNSKDKLDCKMHSSFMHTRRVQFYDCCKDTRTLVAEDTNDWFAYLRRLNCKKVRLFYTISDNANEFTGSLINESVKWVLETVFDQHSDYWTFKWYCATSGWNVEYNRTFCHQPIVDRQEDLVQTREGLDHNFTILRDFAKEIEWKSDSNYFNQLKDLLYTDNPHEPEFHEGLIVSENYSLLAMQVLFSAVNAWCFSGMGSWSDNCVFSEQLHARKEDITRKLFYMVCDAYVLSVNSY